MEREDAKASSGAQEGARPNGSGRDMSPGSAKARWQPSQLEESSPSGAGEAACLSTSAT